MRSASRVIASRGAGAVAHFPPAVEAGADAVLAASVFHFGTLRIADVKDGLAEAGLPVRSAQTRKAEIHRLLGGALDPLGGLVANWCLQRLIGEALDLGT